MRKTFVTVALLLGLCAGTLAMMQKAFAMPPVAKLSPEQQVEVAKNCPGLNGQLPKGVKDCPALKDPRMFMDPAKCPALNGPNGPGSKAVLPKAEARMKKIARTLERNKKSSDMLIETAIRAGADPNAIEDMKKLSRMFRELFMAAVPPQQILESMLAAPKGGAGQEGIIITAPDGSQWLIIPQEQGDGVAEQPKQSGQAPLAVQPSEVAPGTPPNPAAGQPAPTQQIPQVQEPIKAGPGETILFNETLPYWPTKENLGKAGLLKYLEDMKAGK